MAAPRSRTALVTGAGRGIGRDLAIALAGAGLSVGLIARNADELKDTLRACLDAGAKTGAKAIATACDLTDWDGATAALDTIGDWLGPIDLLVNNAGKADGRAAVLWESDPADWRATVETNLLAPYFICRALLPDMVARGRGRVINISTLMAMVGQPEYSGYSASKAALARLTDCLLDDLSGRFIDSSLDDLDELRKHAPGMRGADARLLRLQPYCSDDKVIAAAQRLG